MNTHCHAALSISTSHTRVDTCSNHVLSCTSAVSAFEKSQSTCFFFIGRSPTFIGHALAMNSAVLSIHVGDIDGDGFVDLLYAANGAKVVWFRSSGGRYDYSHSY